MNNTANLIRLAFVLFFVLLLQIVVFDNLDFLGLCNPFIYILFILVAPFGCPTWLLMLMAGGAGLIIDVASNTPGMHAAASILIAYLRPVVLRLIAFRNTTYKEGDMPGSHAYGSMWFARYTLIIVAIHHLALFLIEQFDSRDAYVGRVRAVAVEVAHDDGSLVFGEGYCAIVSAYCVFEFGEFALLDFIVGCAD